MINNNDLKLFENSCKETLMTIVKESETLNKKLTFFQKTLLYDKIKEMSLHEVQSLLFEDGKTAAQYGIAGYTGAKLGGYAIGGAPIKSFGHTIVRGKSVIKKGLFGTKGRLVGAAAAAALLFLFKRAADPCMRRFPTDQRSRMECKAAAARKVIVQIQANMQTCYNSEDPMGCRNKLHKQLELWQNKLTEYTGQLEKLK
jgi:hypothetical protein